jgi:hypothetical protein
VNERWFYLGTSILMIFTAGVMLAGIILGYE